MTGVARCDCGHKCVITVASLQPDLSYPVTAAIVADEKDRVDKREFKRDKQLTGKAKRKQLT